MRQHRGRWERISNDRRALGSKDMCLFKANRLPIGAKPRGMVQIDTSQDRTVCVDPIDSVQSPAQSHFQNDRIELGVFEHAQDGKGRKFEIGQLAVNLHTGRFDFAQLKHFDRQTGGGPSGQFRYKINKDGQPAKRGNEALPTAEFNALLAQVEASLRRLGADIFAGDIRVAPVRLSASECACDRCEFRPICRFDPWTEPFRKLSGDSETEEGPA
ncbi:hypothetical protein EBR44_13460 [bacterium]|nr:hypothetical protein [bacterium]